VSPFFLRKAADRAPSGTTFSPPDSQVRSPPRKMKDAVFGSDLSYEDLVDNFLRLGAPSHRRHRGPWIASRVRFWNPNPQG